MNETAEQTEQTDDPQAVADAAYAEAMEGQENDSGDGDEISRVRKEAANYRRKLRDAEAERDRLAARISDYDRAEVERQVAGEGGLQQASASGQPVSSLTISATTKAVSIPRRSRKPAPEFSASIHTGDISGSPTSTPVRDSRRLSSRRPSGKR